MAEVMVRGREPGRYCWCEATLVPGGPWVPGFDDREMPNTGARAYVVRYDTCLLFLYEYDPVVAVLRASRWLLTAGKIQALHNADLLDYYDAVCAVLTPEEKEIRSKWNETVLEERAKA